MNLVYDELENNSVYKEIIDNAGKEAMECIEKLENLEYKNINYFWFLKTQILKDKYDIDWKSPDKLNKDVIFD